MRLALLSNDPAKIPWLDYRTYGVPLAREMKKNRHCVLPLRTIVAADRHIFLRKIACPHGGLAVAEAQIGANFDLVRAHELRQLGFIIGRVARAILGHTHAVEPDRELIALGPLARFADRHHDAAPIGVLTRDRRFNER